MADTVMQIITLNGYTPIIADDAFVAPGSRVIGDGPETKMLPTHHP